MRAPMMLAEQATSAVNIVARIWLVGLTTGVVCLALATALVVEAGDFAPDLPDRPPSAAEARALGAEWRANKSEASARRYADTLIAAGLYDELLTEITVHGLLARDAPTAALLTAEATLRQGRYAAAFAAAKRGAESPYLAYIRARAAYALTGSPEAAMDDLALALRGPQALVTDAWLFRARLALDANDFDTAEAAGRRAVETGGDLRRARDVSLEAAIRSGTIEMAEQEIAERLQRRGPASGEDLRLSALILLTKGDARGAARHLDEARLSGAEGNRGKLTLALAKWLSGDGAQGYALANAHLGSAPRDWIALDLAAAIARDLGRADEANALLDRLEAARPALALYRREATLDETFGGLAKFAGNLSTEGAAAALTGRRDFAALKEPDEDYRRIVALAASLASDDHRAIRNDAKTIIDDASSPLALALAGAGYLRIGDAGRAEVALKRASAETPHFFEPVRLRARMFAAASRQRAAICILTGYLGSNPGHDPAQLMLATLHAESGAAAAAAETFAAVSPDILFADEKAAALYAKTAMRAGPMAKRKMLSAASDWARSPLIFGRVQEAVGDDPGAAASFRRGLIDDPLNADLPALYLAAMRRQDRAEEARSLLAEIVRRRPEAAAARNALAGLDVEAGGIAQF